MKCDDFDTWIHLIRPGELEAKEKELLEAHIKSCTRCREKFVSMNDYKDFLSMLQKGPVLHFPESLTSRIMASVNELSMAPQRRDFFSVPSLVRIQWIMGILVIVFASWFFLENAYTFHKIASLEKKVSTKKMVPEFNFPFENHEMKMAVIASERLSRIENSRYAVFSQKNLQLNKDKRKVVIAKSNTSYWVKFLRKHSSFLADERLIEKWSPSLKTL